MRETLAMRGLRITLIVITALIGIAWFVVGLLFDGYRAASESMRPTIAAGDALLVRTGTDARFGDIVVLRPPEGRGAGASTDLKRVVGVGGDRIELDGGHLVRNGRVVQEPYLGRDVETTLLEPVTVPKGSVYVLGDLRQNSTDSRAYGPVRRDDLVGRVVIVGLDLPRILLYGLGGSLVLLVLVVATERSRMGRDPRGPALPGW